MPPRFHDSDALIEALDALTAMDRQLGFRALNQLAHSAAASIRAPSSGARASLAGTSGSGGNSSAGDSGGVAGSVAGAGQAATVAGWCNTLLMLSYLNHNPGYEPVQVSWQQRPSLVARSLLWSGASQAQSTSPEF